MHLPSPKKSLSYLVLLLLLPIGCESAGRIKQALIPDRSAEFQSFLRQGAIDFNREYYSTAVYDYDRALEIRPDCGECYFSRGMAKMKMEDYGGAIEDLRASIDQKYDQVWWSYYTLGVIYELKSDSNRASLNYIQVSLAKPDFWTQFLGPRLLDVNIPRFNDCLQGYQEMVGMIQKRRDLTKERAKLYLFSGACRGEVGDYGGAVEDTTRAIALDARFARAYYSRAMAREKGFHDDDATLKDYTRAIDLDPDLGMAYYRRGMFYMVHLRNAAYGCDDLLKASNFRLPVAEEAFEQYCIPASILR